MVRAFHRRTVCIVGFSLNPILTEIDVEWLVIFGYERHCKDLLTIVVEACRFADYLRWNNLFVTVFLWAESEIISCKFIALPGF